MQKTIWPVLIVTAILGAAFFIGFRSASKPLAGKAPLVAPSSASSDPATLPNSPDSTAASPSYSAAASSSSPAIKAPVSSAPVSAPQRTPVTTLSALQRINEKIDAAADDSTTPESLALLVSYASDDNADVRTTALNGLIRRGDAAAAPLLRAAAKKMDSSEAIIALLKTADYLELPAATLHEIAAMPKPLKTDSRPSSFRPAAPPTEDKP